MRKSPFLLPKSLYNVHALGMTFSPSTSPPRCWPTSTMVAVGILPITPFLSSPMQSQVRPSTYMQILGSRSPPLLELSSVNWSLVGWLMLSVVKKCVGLSYLACLLFLIRLRWCRAHDHHCRYFCPSPLWKFPIRQNYWRFGCLALRRKSTSFLSTLNTSPSIFFHP